MGRGILRIYLGAAPGVGKTYAMLSEAHRRVERGTDCVVAFVEHHDRPRTEVMLHGLELLPRRELEYRGTVFTEMDVDAVLERAPAVALVDELAHTNVPGSRNAKRWQDVEELLRAGIDVISTVNIQHLESLGDVVESIAGVRQRETVPDEVVRRADQIELVDMSPGRCAAGWRTGTSTGPTRWTRRSRTTSGPATSPPCASWRCSGSPTGWTSTSSSTGASTTSAPPGRPANASSSD